MQKIFVNLVNGELIPFSTLVVVFVDAFVRGSKETECPITWPFQVGLACGTKLSDNEVEMTEMTKRLGEVECVHWSDRQYKKRIWGLIDKIAETITLRDGR